MLMRKILSAMWLSLLMYTLKLPDYPETQPAKNTSDWGLFLRMFHNQDGAGSVPQRGAMASREKTIPVTD
jgi:hypothetical protein